MTTIASTTSPIWTRKQGNWHLNRDGRSIACLERTYDGWFCYASDPHGTRWFVGACGRLSAGKAALEAFRFHPAFHNIPCIGEEAPM